MLIKVYKTPSLSFATIENAMTKCYNVNMIDALESTMFSSAVSLYTPVVVSATTSTSSVQSSTSTKSPAVVNQTDDINDSVSISTTAIDMLKTEKESFQYSSNQEQSGSQDSDSSKSASSQEENNDSVQNKPNLTLVQNNLSVDEHQEVVKLQQNDEQIKKHNEVQTMAARGIQVTPARYQTEKGPDGKEYVVSGKVEISFIPTSNPSENLQKAQIMKKAALSAVPPTIDDIKLAQKATKLIDSYSKEVKQSSLSSYFKEGRRA